jgi:hypothetical protein
MRPAFQSASGFGQMMRHSISLAVAVLYEIHRLGC